MATTKIAVLVGSLRRESFTRKYARALMELAPDSLQMEIVEIGELPPYNQDLDEENRAPSAWTAFRDAVRPARGVLFCTPEYNRSVPGVLKNAIDVGSRPYGKSVWTRKPCGVVSVSPGAIGGFGANHHLRQSLVFLDMPVLQQPEAYISAADKALADGRITKPETREFLGKFMQAFTDWVEFHAGREAGAGAARQRAQGAR